MSKTKKQNFTRNVMILMISQIIVKFLGLFYRLYLTNKEGFGDVGNAIYSSGFQIYVLLLTISSVGVPNAISKLISERLSRNNVKNAVKVFKISLVLFSIIGFTCSLLLFFGADIIANKILIIPESKLTIQVLSPSIFFVSVISVFRGYFNGRANMKPTARSQTIEQLSKTVLTIIIVEFLSIIYVNNSNRTIYMAAGANLATTFGTIISLFIIFRFYRNDKLIVNKNIKTKSESIKNIVLKILQVSIPITFSVILGTINKNIDSITVVRLLKSFLTENEAKIQYGILSGKVDTLVTLPMALNIALSTSLVPNISASIAKNNIQDVKKKISYSLLITNIIGLPCMVGMIIFATPILNLLFPNASSGSFVLQISAIGMYIILVNQTITSILQGLGKQNIPVISLSIGVLVKIIINIVLIPINPKYFILGGTVGASVGTILCYLVSLIINFSYLRKTVKIKFYLANQYFKPIISSIIMAYISLNSFHYLKFIFSEKISTILSILIAIIVYGLCVFLIFSKKKSRKFNKKQKLKTVDTLRV